MGRPKHIPVQTAAPVDPAGPTREIAPLLRQLMADYAATGLPPAYLALHQPDEEDPTR